MNECDKAVEYAVEMACLNTDRRFGQYVATEDIQQECHLWILSDPDRANRALATSGQRGLIRQLTKVGERYARKEKAHWVGFKPEDEVFYNNGLLEAVLPDVFDDSATSYRQPPEGLKNKVYCHTEYETVLADVRRVLRWVTLEDRLLLSLRFHEGYDLERLAVYYGEEIDDVQTRLGKALNRLVGKLGGRSPYWRVDVNWL